MIFIIVIIVSAPVFTPKPFTPKAKREFIVEPPVSTKIPEIKEPETPERPSLPVETKSDEEIDVSTIPPNIGGEALKKLPAPSEPDTFVFIPYDTPPRVKQLVLPEYPEIAIFEGIPIGFSNYPDVRANRSEDATKILGSSPKSGDKLAHLAIPI